MDDWAQVSDIEERRKIQNRLSQRKRRNRLRDQEESQTRDQGHGTSRQSRNKTCRESTSPKARSESTSKETSIQPQQMVFDMNLEPIGYAAPFCPNMINGTTPGPDPGPVSEDMFSIPTCEANAGEKPPPQQFEMADPLLKDYFSMDGLEGTPTYGINNNYYPIQTPSTMSERSGDSYSSSSTGHGSDSLDFMAFSRFSLLRDRCNNKSSRDVFSDLCNPSQMRGTGVQGAAYGATTAQNRLESKIDLAILSIMKLYESGVCLDLLYEDTKVLSELEGLRSRLHRLIQTDARNDGYSL